MKVPLPANSSFRPYCWKDRESSRYSGNPRIAASTSRAGASSVYGTSGRSRLALAPGRRRGAGGGSAGVARRRDDGGLVSTARTVTASRSAKSGNGVERFGDPGAGFLGGVGDRRTLGEDRDQHVGQDVGRLDVRAVGRGRGEAAVLGGGVEDRQVRVVGVHVEQGGRVGDDPADGGHLGLEVGPGQQLHPVEGQVLAL